MTVIHPTAHFSWATIARRQAMRRAEARAMRRREALNTVVAVLAMAIVILAALQVQL